MNLVWCSLSLPVVLMLFIPHTFTHTHAHIHTHTRTQTHTHTRTHPPGSIQSTARKKMCSCMGKPPKKVKERGTYYLSLHHTLLTFGFLSITIERVVRNPYRFVYLTRDPCPRPIKNCKVHHLNLCQQTATKTRALDGSACMPAFSDLALLSE